VRRCRRTPEPLPPRVEERGAERRRWGGRGRRSSPGCAVGELGEVLGGGGGDGVGGGREVGGKKRERVAGGKERRQRGGLKNLYKWAPQVLVGTESLRETDPSP
jgi:hypothetical protein